jgi:integrase
VERLILQTTYACGLRASEVLGLRVPDVDSARMLLWVRHGKGQKDRGVPLSPALLAWIAHRALCESVQVV